MERSRQKSVRAKEADHKGQSVQLQKDLWRKQRADELRYQVISDENSIYEYDMDCMREKEK